MKYLLLLSLLYSCAGKAPLNKIDKGNSFQEEASSSFIADEGVLTCQQQLETGGEYSICRHVESGKLILNLPVECESSDGPNSSIVSPKRRVSWSLGIYSGAKYTDNQGFFNIKIPATQKHFVDELVLKGKYFKRSLNIARVPTVLILSANECGL